MKIRDTQSSRRTAFAALLIAGSVIIPGTASAYVGPGAGLGAIGTVLALFGAILLGIVGFVWYPVKRILVGKHSSSTDEEDESGDDVPVAAERAESKPEDR